MGDKLSGGQVQFSLNAISSGPEVIPEFGSRQNGKGLGGGDG